MKEEKKKKNGKIRGKREERGKKENKLMQENA